MIRLLQTVGFFYPSPRYAMAFVGLSITELCFLTVYSGKYWTHAGISWHGRILLVFWLILSAAAFGWLVYWAANGVAGVSRRWSTLARAGSIFLALLCTAATAFYIVSWSYYWRTGMFLDGETLEFGLRNASMMWQYLWQAERNSLVLLTVSLVVALGLFGVLWNRHCSTGTNSGRRVEILRGLLTIAIATNFGVLAAAFYGDSAIANDQSKGWWNKPRVGRDFELRYRVSPLLTLVTSPLLRPEEKIGDHLSSDVLGPPRTTPYQVKHVEQRRNHSVIIVAMESLRSDIVMLKHQGREVMPHLNELARTGRWSTRAYAQSSHSNYADPALLSSLYPLRSVKHHYYSRSDPWPKVLLYDVLKERGYNTAIFSSQNETWGYMDAFLESPRLDVFFDSRSYDGPTMISEKDAGFSRYAREAKVAGKLDDAITMERAISWLKHRSDGNPFCLCMNLQTSHFPYEMPPGKSGPFGPSEIDFQISFAGYPEEKVSIVKNAYYNALHYMDEQLGRLIDHLESAGLREETLLVVAGDNGECFYENGHPTHAGPPFEPAVHVALIMHCPGSIHPEQDDYITQMIDVVPTIVGWLRLPQHPCFQGIDILATDRPPATGRAAFVHCCAFFSNADAIVTDSGWKLIIDRRTGQKSLFDLNQDPREQENVAARQSEICAALADLLDKWRQRQLVYYATPAIHGMFYPPKTPDVEDDILLRSSMTELTARTDQ